MCDFFLTANVRLSADGAYFGLGNLWGEMDSSISIVLAVALEL
jgi:hypothetical protein